MNGELNLSDLHNPQHVTAVFHRRKMHWIGCDPKTQGFQEWPGSWEVWEKLEDGRLMRVARWLKKSIAMVSTRQ